MWQQQLFEAKDIATAAHRRSIYISSVRKKRGPKLLFRTKKVTCHISFVASSTPKTPSGALNFNYRSGSVNHSSLITRRAVCVPIGTERCSVLYTHCRGHTLTVPHALAPRGNSGSSTLRVATASAIKNKPAGCHCVHSISVCWVEPHVIADR